MLSKLIKHELRATARIMLPVMGALFALALLANLSMRGLTGGLSDVSVLRILFILVIVFFGIGVVATAVMAVVIMVSRFYRNLLKDEGYLMFTLPVNVHELVWAKLIVSLIWFLATALLICLVMTLTAFNIMNTSLDMILEGFPTWEDIRKFLSETGLLSQVTTLIFQFVLVVVLGTLLCCLHFYASMSLGHMLTKSKVLMSVLFFIGISFVFNILEMSYGMIGFTMKDPGSISDAAESLKFISSLMWHGIFLSAVQSAILYVATVFGLQRGLNLE